MGIDILITQESVITNTHSKHREPLIGPNLLAWRDIGSECQGLEVVSFDFP